MSLKAKIEAKKQEIASIGDPGSDETKKTQKAIAEGQLKVLEEAHADKEVFDQDDLNRVDQQANQKAKDTKDKIETMFGTDLESVQGVLEQFENVLPKDDSGQEGEGGEGKEGDADVLNRALSTIQSQGETIKTLKDDSSSFQRQYFAGDIEQKLNSQLEQIGLVREFEAPASRYLQNVVGVSDLVDKRMKGEQVTDEEIQAKVKQVSEDSPVWFQTPPNPDAPGIPQTPEGAPPKSYTDEERQNVSIASGGKVF